MDPITAARQTTESFAASIDALSAEQLTNGTPCPKFDVRGVVNHGIGGLNMFTGMLGGSPADDAGEDADVAGLATAYRAAAEQLLAAAEAEGALQKSVQLGPMEIPGAAAVTLIAADHVVHAWDMARGAGAAHGMSDELGEFALEALQQMIAPPMRDGEMFAAEQDCSADAPVMDRLAAFSGRAV